MYYVQAPFFAGTLVPRQGLLKLVLKHLEGLPAHMVEACLVAEQYYGPVIKVFERWADEVDLITLHQLGVCRPLLRHQQASIVVKHKSRHRQLPPSIIVSGHSQGGLEALDFGLEHASMVRAMFLFAAPLLGTFADSYWGFYSGYLKRLRQRQEQLIRQFDRNPLMPLPEIHVFMANNDGIIGQDSALGIHEDYPNVSKYCLSYLRPAVATAVEWIPSAWWGDNHVGMMLDGHLLAKVDQILANLLSGIKPHAAADSQLRLIG